MKKRFLAATALAAVMALSVGAAATVSADSADSYSASDWKPFNYVLTSGAGSNTKYNDIRTFLDFSDNKLTANGRTTSGGMGVSFVPEIDIDNFEINFTLNSWQKVSTDRWFGFTLTDVLEKADRFNEVPFYGKHSESWSNDYGAGVLFALRPAEDGNCTIQFNYIGIEPSYDADGNFNSVAGNYADGFLGWAGYLSTIQLCNEDWTPKTDYENIKVTMKPTTENGKNGVAFEINDGYYYRTDYVYGSHEDERGLVIGETNFEADVFETLDLDGNGFLTESEFNNFIYGSAWNNGADKKSIIPYANYGDSFYALKEFAGKLSASGKRLYMSFMYKDAWDIREGSPDASFTINTVNGKAATKGENINLLADKTVEGNVKATINYKNLHAGVNPSDVEKVVLKDVDASKYAKAMSAIESTANSLKKGYSVVNVKAETERAVVSFIGEQTVSVSTEKYAGAKIYKVVGSDIDEVSSTEEGGYVTFKVNSSDTQIVIMSDNGANNGGKVGCGSGIEGCFGAFLLVPAAAVVLAVKKRKNEKNN